nr:unnamed protein product [Digitaria exilis]
MLVSFRNPWPSFVRSPSLYHQLWILENLDHHFTPVPLYGIILAQVAVINELETATRTTRRSHKARLRPSTQLDCSVSFSGGRDSRWRMAELVRLVMTSRVAVSPSCKQRLTMYR